MVGLYYRLSVVPWSLPTAPILTRYTRGNMCVYSAGVSPQPMKCLIISIDSVAWAYTPAYLVRILYLHVPAFCLPDAHTRDQYLDKG
jgi:hypothetical protein